MTIGVDNKLPFSLFLTENGSLFVLFMRFLCFG